LNKEDRKILELQTYCELQIKSLFKSNLDIIEFMMGGKKAAGFGTIRSSVLRSGNDAIRNIRNAFSQYRKEK
jgi:hypothetical protein